MHTGQCRMCYVKPEIMQSSSSPGKESRCVCVRYLYLRQRQCGSVSSSGPLRRQVK